MRREELRVRGERDRFDYSSWSRYEESSRKVISLCIRRGTNGGLIIFWRTIMPRHSKAMALHLIDF